MNVQGRWIFIVGCQRSGTTLTGQILGAHSACFLVDEPDGLYSLFDAKLAGSESSSENLSGVIDKAGEKYTDDRNGLDVSSVLNRYRLIAKAPNLTYDWSSLASRFDEPVILYPVRDVRSVVSSILKLERIPIVKNQVSRMSKYPELVEEYSGDFQTLTHRDTPEHIRAALVWKIKTGLYKKFEHSGLNPHVFKYEDLVANQLKCITAIARRCDLAFEQEMLQYHLVMEGRGPGDTSRERGIDSDSLSKWKSGLSQEQVNDILDVGGELMLELGYEIPGVRSK